MKKELSAEEPIALLYFRQKLVVSETPVHKRVITEHNTIIKRIYLQIYQIMIKYIKIGSIEREQDRK